MVSLTSPAVRSLSGCRPVFEMLCLLDWRRAVRNGGRFSQRVAASIRKALPACSFERGGLYSGYLDRYYDVSILAGKTCTRPCGCRCCTDNATLADVSRTRTRKHITAIPITAIPHSVYAVAHNRAR